MMVIMAPHGMHRTGDRVRREAKVSARTRRPTSCYNSVFCLALFLFPLVFPSVRSFVTVPRRPPFPSCALPLSGAPNSVFSECFLSVFPVFSQCFLSFPQLSPSVFSVFPVLLLVFPCVKSAETLESVNEPAIDGQPALHNLQS